MNLAALLFNVVHRQPDAPAVSDGVRDWSYHEFADRISRLAGSFADRGLQNGDRVMLCMENCAEFLECLFACWTAGLCAVPVNARLHAPRGRVHCAGLQRPDAARDSGPGASSASARTISRGIVCYHCDPQRELHGAADAQRVNASS